MKLSDWRARAKRRWERLNDRLPHWFTHIKSRWERLALVAVIGLIVAIAVIRLIVALLLPVVIERVARVYDMDCDYDRLDLSILGGSAQIWNVRLTPRQGTEPILQTDYGQADISVLNLLRGRLVIYRVAADGVEMNIERTSDGRLPLLEQLIPNSTAPPANSTGPPAPMNFQPPLRIDALRLTHVRATLDDKFVQPRMQSRVALDLRLTDFGVPDQPTQFELDLSSDPMLDSLDAHGTTRDDGSTIQADIEVLLRGLHPRSAAAYLAQLGLRPTADDLSASMDGTLVLTNADNAYAGAKVHLNLSRALATCDGRTAAALDELTLEIPSLTASSADIKSCLISGVRCNAQRSSDGCIGACGVEYAPAAPTSTATSSALSLPAFHVRLQQFAVSDLQANFSDQFVSPPVALALDVSQFIVNAQPLHDSTPISFSALVAAPGMVRQAEIDGQANPFAAKKTFQIKASADGITLGAIQPYLAMAGLSSEWKNGSFRMAADGTLAENNDGQFTADAQLRQFSLTDSGNLLSLDGAQLVSAGFDPRTATIHAKDIQIQGPALSFQRDSSGDLHALGFHLDMKSLGSGGNSNSLAGIVTGANSLPLSLIPNLDIGHFTWKNIRLTFSDNAVSPPTSLAIADAGVDVTNFICSVPQGTTSKGEIHAWLSAPNIAPKVQLDGTITSQSNSLALDSDLQASGLCGNALATYLQPIGLQPTLRSASLQAHSDLQITDSPGGLALGLSARDVSLNDYSESLFTLGDLSVVNLHVLPDRLAVDSININKPDAQVTRHDDGRVELLGMLFSSRAAQSAHSILDDVLSIPSLPIIDIGRLQISDASMHWRDRAVNPVVDSEVATGVDLRDFEFGPAEKPAEIHLWTQASGSLDSLRADGTVAASLDNQAAHLIVSATGIRPGSAASYFPAGVSSTLRNGKFNTVIDAAVRRNPLGGKELKLGLTNLNLQDGADIQPLLAFDSFHAKASRIDPDAKLMSVDEVTLNGLETRAHASANGLQLAGLQFSKSTAPTAPPTSQETTNTPASSNAPESSAQLLQQVAAERNRLPLVTLNNLDLNCRKFQFSYDSPANPPPLVLSRIHLHNKGNLVWLGRDVESNPTTELELTGRLDTGGPIPQPIAESFQAEIHTLPFLRQKTLGLDFVVDGIHSGGVVAALPNLGRDIKTYDFPTGRLNGSLNLSLQLKNVRQTEINFAYGGKMDIGLKDLQFRTEQGGLPLAGVSEIHAENVAIGPGFSSLEAPELSIENVSGRASRYADGIHFLNVVIPFQNNSQSLSPASAPAQPSVAAADNSQPPRLFQVDRLLISGMDFKIQDCTVNPPLLVPIAGLDLEALGLSSAMFTEQTPLRFSVLVDAGKVPLSSSATTQPTERQLFSQVTGNGVLTLSPHVKGWAKASVSGLELTSLKSMAKTYGVTLGGGTFDGDMDLRFPGDGSIDTSTRLVLTDLSLSEPPNGRLSHALNLPAPLDVVIGALEDQDGSITIPLNVAINQGQINGGSLVASASASFLGVVAVALASSPLKVADLAGLNSPQAQREPPITMVFPPGYPGLDSDQTLLLENLSSRLQRDQSLEVTIRHDLGSDDIALAGQRVNPSQTDALDLADAFNRRREELLASRQVAASDVRALLASTATDQAAIAIDRLRTIERQLTDIDNALDRIYDLSRPGADRQNVRRTRQACLEIAAARLQAASDILKSSGKKAVDPTRIHLTNARLTSNPTTPDGELVITVVRTK